MGRKKSNKSKQAKKVSSGLQNTSSQSFSAIEQFVQLASSIEESPDKLALKINFNSLDNAQRFKNECLRQKANPSDIEGNSNIGRYSVSLPKKDCLTLNIKLSQASSNQNLADAVWSPSMLMSSQFSQEISRISPTNVNNIKKLLNEETKGKVEPYLSQLAEIEIAHYQRELWIKIQADFIDQIEKSNTYQLALNVIQSIRWSNNYTADLSIKDGVLEKVNKVEIRTSGKQHRHISPVGLVERIFLNALQVGQPVEVLIKNLLHKISLFKPYLGELDEKGNNYIQAVFEIYKNPDKYNQSDLGDLIKTLAHFYNEISFLSMNDDYVEIPYATNNCFVVPLSNTDKLLVHKQEGSFINSMLSILDEIHHDLEKISTNRLTTDQLAHLNYVVFAIFDYLPLPSPIKIKNQLPKKIDKDSHRYSDEPLERLAKVMYNHLAFIFESYSLFKEYYAAEITTRFIDYVANGVTIKDLCSLFGLNHEEELVRLLDSRSNVTIDSYYIKTFLLYHRGFSRQYSVADFVKQLSDLIEKIGQQHGPLSNREASIISTGSSVIDYHAVFKQEAINVFTQLFLKALCDKDFSFDFTSLQKEYKLTFIDLKVFNTTFQAQFINLNKTDTHKKSTYQQIAQQILTLIL